MELARLTYLKKTRPHTNACARAGYATVEKLEEFARRVDQVLANDLNCDGVGTELVPARDRIDEVLADGIDWDQRYVELTRGAP